MRMLATAVLLGCSTASLAGVVMQMQDKDLQDPQATSDTQTFYFQDGAFRTEQSAESQVSLFRDQTIYMIDPKKRSYSRIDKAQMDQLGSQLSGMRSQLEAQMAKLPPEQRAAMEAALGGLGGGTAAKAKAPTIAVRDTGRSETAAGYGCKVFEILSNGKKEHEVCAAAPASFPGGNDMLKSMREVGTFISGMTKGLTGGESSAMGGYWAQLQQINGVPIITRDFDAQGKPDSEMRLVAAKSEALPATLFEVPKGYTEKKVPNLGSIGSSDDDDEDER